MRRSPWKLLLNQENCPGIKTLQIETRKRAIPSNNHLRRRFPSTCALWRAGRAGWRSPPRPQRLPPPRWRPSLCGRPPARLSAGRDEPNHRRQCILPRISASPETLGERGKERVASQSFLKKWQQNDQVECLQHLILLNNFTFFKKCTKLAK